jgi:hypothetical protein
VQTSSSQAVAQILQSFSLLDWPLILVN